MNKSAREAQYRALHAQGLTCVEMGTAMGVSTSAVAQWLRNHDLAANGNGNVPHGERRALDKSLDDARPIPGAFGYLATRDGRIFSCKTEPTRELTHKAHGGRDGPRDGPRVGLSLDGRRKFRFVATLVLEAWIGPRPEGYTVGYKDGDMANVSADNLEWRMGRSHVEAAEFVRTWQDCFSSHEVAEILGVSIQYTFQMARRLRGRGVPLKMMNERMSDDELEALKRMCE